MLHTSTLKVSCFNMPTPKFFHLEQSKTSGENLKFGRLGMKVAADENWKSLSGNYGFLTLKRTAFIRPGH